MNTKQKTISEKIHPGPKYLRIFFFITGIIATIAYRITFLLDPSWTKIVWYVGTIGFTLYFGHRMSIEAKRARLVKDYQLVKVLEDSNIEGEKKNAVAYLIKTSLTSKARFNSAFIFFASILAFIASVALDLYHYYY